VSAVQNMTGNVRIT